MSVQPYHGKHSRTSAQHTDMHACTLHDRQRAHIPAQLLNTHLSLSLMLHLSIVPHHSPHSLHSDPPGSATAHNSDEDLLTGRRHQKPTSPTCRLDPPISLEDPCPR